MQAQAEQARNILPNSAIGFDASVVALDTTTGAIRAMVGGRGLRSDVPAGEVNMALAPRQTGSSIRGGGIEIGPLNGRNTWSSTDCGFIRLGYSVGLHRVVDSVYRMAHSTYFYQGQPEDEHESFKPLGVTATGNNAMSPLDMATGMQTITNQGLHPYYVEYIERVDGGRFYSHLDAGIQVLDQGVANATVLTLKGVIRSGTGARNLRNFSRPATGKTGTQDDNTNAWFVGGTPQITTAVWVGDPNGQTPMNRIPEFAAEMGRNGKVQGADYPARIWGAFMEAAHVNLPVVDWPPPPANPRPAARLYWPGEECLAKLVSGTLPPTGPTTTPAATTTTQPASTLPGDPPPAVTTVPRAVVVQIPSATNVPLDVLDPRAPMPSIDTRTYVYPCAAPPANVVVQKKST